MTPPITTTLYSDMENVIQDYCDRQSPELEFDWAGDEIIIADYDERGREHAEEIIKILQKADLIAGGKPYFYEEPDKENNKKLNYKIGMLKLDS